MLKEFGHAIWTANGSDVVAMLGFHYPTRMVVISLSGENLFVWSPVALTEDLRADVDALGKVRYLVAPNSLHHLFIADWKHAYPDARIYAAPGLQEKRKDIAFDDELDGASVPEWSGEIEYVVVRGNAITSEAVFFHRKSGTVIFTDLIQQFPAGWFSGWRSIVAKWDLMLGPEPSVPRKFRAAFTNRHAARGSLERILAWPSEKVLMAHGTPVIEDSQAFLRRAFRWLVA
ncbi:DUF4336 domain-containing protein [Methylobacterium nodulans]|uniref:DUF4336 domain-containing protein n=1 Tax=Methylobacterium nodulans (strain LMG 21967 / CNCM I-2342 / ORS 2060) TaxID=460265 RepID=B8ICD4_METNO|nr:DUF4336 domain-containing protein [Methylobacterium nodulans]ACL55522.1 conserved hypothetical protein [Methylobacterium nodulans ORS 2060]